MRETLSQPRLLPDYPKRLLIRYIVRCNMQETWILSFRCSIRLFACIQLARIIAVVLAKAGINRKKDPECHRTARVHGLENIFVITARGLILMASTRFNVIVGAVLIRLAD